MDYQKLLEQILEEATSQGASDVNFSPNHYPTIRVDTRLVPLSKFNVLDPETSQGLVFAILGEEKKNRFLAERDLDFSYLYKDNRFRVNAYQTKGFFAAALRFIPERIPTIEELNLPEIVKVFSRVSQGFVLVVGPNGHGKSTTLASMIDLINHERAEKVITIEDPIEYVFTPDKCVIDQREVYSDTLSFHKALRSTFRENVDVIMVGEMRDYETMSVAVSAAETGHLVFASLHTNNAIQTIDRIVNSFPSNQQPQIRDQLAATITGVISQRLLPRINGGLIPATEVLIANSAVRNLIREGRSSQLNNVIETSFNQGMISMERSLASLVNKKEISMDQAEFYAMDTGRLKELL